MMTPQILAGGLGGSIGGNPIEGFVDLGDTRLAWGRADSVLRTQTFLFSASFAAPPEVHITPLGTSQKLSPRAITPNGFTVARQDPLFNPAAFSWLATGLKPGVEVPATDYFDICGLPNYSAAVRAQRAGIRNARIFCGPADSTTVGTGANALSTVTNDKVNSYPTLLAAILSARGSKASWASWIGNGNTPVISQYDHRISFGTGWGLSNQETPAAAGHVPAGFALRSYGTTKFNFDTVDPVDTVEIYTLAKAPAMATSAPGFIVSVDDVDTGTVIPTVFDSSPAGGLVKTVVAMPRGRHTISIRSAGTTDNSFCLGMIAYDSSEKEITILNGGWGTSTAAMWNNVQGKAWSPLPGLAALNPDLCILNLGINDSIQNTPGLGNPPTSKAAYMRDMQALIDAIRTNGSDVLLCVPNQIGQDFGGYLDRFIPYIFELGETNSIPVVDLRNALGQTWDIANAAGYMRDHAHPNATGYMKIAQLIADTIMPV